MMRLHILVYGLDQFLAYEFPDEKLSHKTQRKHIEDNMWYEARRKVAQEWNGKFPEFSFPELFNVGFLNANKPVGDVPHIVINAFDGLSLPELPLPLQAFLKAVILETIPISEKWTKEQRDAQLKELTEQKFLRN